MTGLFYAHICGSLGNGKSCYGRVEDEANAPSSSSLKVMLMDSPTIIMARRRTNRTTMDKARSMMSFASPRNIRQHIGSKPFRHNSAPSESSRRDSTERTSDAGPQLPEEDTDFGGGDRKVVHKDDFPSVQSTRMSLRPSLGLRFQSEAKLRLHQQNEQRRQSYYCPPNNHNKDEPRLFRGPINKLMSSHGTTSEAGPIKTRSDEWHHASQKLAEELTQRFGQQPCSRSSAIGRPDDDGVGRLHLSAGSLLDPSATLHQRPKLEHALQLQSQRMRNLRRRSQLSLSLPNLDECDAVLHTDIVGTYSHGRRKEKNNDISTSFDLEIEPDEEEQERLKQEKLSSTFHPMSLLPPPSPFEGAGPPDEAASADVVSPSPEADDRASACRVVYQQYLEDYATSNIPDLTRNFPHFELAEVMQGRFLGKGSFAQVIEVKGFCLKHDGLSTSWALTRSTHQRRRDMAGGSVAKCCNSTNINDDNTGDGDNKCTLEYSFDVQQKQDVVDGGRTKSANDDSDCSGEGDDDVSPLKRGFRLGYHDITDDDDDDELYGADNNGCLLIAPIPDGSTGSDKDGSSTAGSADDDGDGFISNMTPSAASGQNNDLQSSRRFVADHCYRSSNANGVAATNTNAKNSTRPIARYALKQLRPNVGDDPLCLLQGLSDMATETRVLSSMADHPNIVKLRGIAHHDGGDGNPFFQQYFILLDRLYDTLESRIVKWKREEQRWRGPVRNLLFDRQQVKRRQLWLDRVTFAYDLSSALAHLHDRYVVHRDLKPDNIGFDLRGDIKVFDLGLAKELPSVHNSHDTLFHFTGMCGSPRYMAPEVALGRPYNELCDVYSFAIVCWEMMAMSKPFGDIGVVGMIEEVWRGADGKDDLSAKQPRRPSPSLVEKGKFWCNRSFKGIWRRRKERRTLHQSKNENEDIVAGTPASLQALLEASWSFQLDKRPPMNQLVQKLHQEILAIRARANSDPSDDRRLSHKRRRSTFIFQSDANRTLYDGVLPSDENDVREARIGNS